MKNVEYSYIIYIVNNLYLYLNNHLTYIRWYHDTNGYNIFSAAVYNINFN